MEDCLMNETKQAQVIENKLIIYFKDNDLIIDKSDDIYLSGEHIEYVTVNGLSHNFKLSEINYIIYEDKTIYNNTKELVKMFNELLK